MILQPETRCELESALVRKGLRTTRQREQVYAVMHDNHDHPTVDEVYELARRRLPGLSLATVYNCLETLVTCGLVRRINAGHPPVRYEPNHGEHAHFYCERTGKVFDINLDEDFIGRLKALLPEGFKAESVHLRFEGQTVESSRD